MAIDNQIRIAAPLVLRVALVGILAGAAYGYFSATTAGGAGLYGIGRGALTGGLIAGILGSLEAFVLRGPLGAIFGRIPFLLNLGLKSLVYLVVFLFGIAAGQWLMPVSSGAGVQIARNDILFCFAVGFVVNFLLEVNRLLGQNVLLSFATGRYYRPRVEQRIFLFIDMTNSTAAAERLGEVDFHRLLNRFVSDLTGALVVLKGEIHKYVGDELIVTWPLAVGLKDARCLSACFAAIGRLSELGPSYQREFGLTVRIRAGLHCGPVVVGEMGTIKKEIALIGDTMNTAARIVDACRDSGEAVIASAALLHQLAIPPGITARALGPVQLRGKKNPVELVALHEKALALDRVVRA